MEHGGTLEMSEAVGEVLWKILGIFSMIKLNIIIFLKIEVENT